MLKNFKTCLCLVFSQRLAPGVVYKIQDLRSCLNNSIRGARYHYKKSQRSLAELTAMMEEEASPENPTDDEHSNTD